MSVFTRREDEAKLYRLLNDTLGINTKIFENILAYNKQIAAIVKKKKIPLKRKFITNRLSILGKLRLTDKQKKFFASMALEFVD